jgi:hypothetical protein
MQMGIATPLEFNCAEVGKRLPKPPSETLTKQIPTTTKVYP